MYLRKSRIWNLSKPPANADKRGADPDPTEEADNEDTISEWVYDPTEPPPPARKRTPASKKRMAWSS